MLGGGASLSEPGTSIPIAELPGSQLPDGTKVGSLLNVFVYNDDDKLLASVARPRLCLHEVAFLTIKDATHFGVFAEWGIDKDLLIPRAEQTGPLELGDRVPIGLIIDASGRLAGTMRVSEMLSTPVHARTDTWLTGEVWRKETRLGTFIILEKRYVGLLPAHEPHRLQRGDVAQFRVANVLEDGKVVLSLRRQAMDERESDAAIVLKVLRAQPRDRVGDHSSPAQIRDVFGMSKKAFKRAVGLLLKDGKIEFDNDGSVRLVTKRIIVR